ncbi:MAG: NADH:flavin oxidoreductase [Cloacibacillus sp.]
MHLLKEPIKIKNVTLKNRLVMPPMATANAEAGAVTRELEDYYDEKSKGGHIGLIILEHSYISREGMAGPRQISISRESDVAGLTRIAEVIHKNGTKAIAQINHAGSAADPSVTGLPAVGPSAVANMSQAGIPGVVPREMTAAEIEAVVEKFAAAAARTKEAGFDGVEIHSAHFYLLNQFYSPLSNRRADAYGGSVKGRIKIHLEVIRAVRKAVGDDYLIALRLGACDYAPGGSTIEDAVYAARSFDAAGVDLLDISGGLCRYTRPQDTAPGYFGDASEAVKNAVRTPVILTGGVTDAASCEKLLEEKKADLIGVGRAILKDSGWAARQLDN